MARSNSMRQINQRGIAIGPILYIVAILAVLVSAIAAGSGSFNGDTSAISAKVKASAIIEYANEVKFAVDKLLAKGCKDTEISFEGHIEGGIINPNSPSDKSCHVFNVNGGGVAIKYANLFGASAIWFVASNDADSNLNGIGNSYNSDLYMRFMFDSNSASHVAICKEINNLFGIDTVPELGGSFSSKIFDGTYLDGSSYENPPASLLGKQAWCSIHNQIARSLFYVLIAR